eukprot:TRINITY_DN239_c0_g1_i1.p3 TRINITY_DN239_c0_g1~~TRINITY_DN239_c0_g1_i1.p3  ORF type:complete len:333 (-),score=6.51 TRINITY_DN239_c0_g1_i1:5050-6048(-)
MIQKIFSHAKLVFQCLYQDCVGASQSQQLIDCAKMSKYSNQAFNPDIDINKDLEPPITSAQFIGSGGFSDVYKTTYKKGQVAVKLFHPTYQDLAEKRRSNEFNKELAIAGYLQNDHIVKFMGASQRLGEKAIVMEYVENNLYQFIRRYQDGSLPLVTIFSICKHVAGALQYLHKRYVHGDLHTANILVDENNIPKVTDFNLSRGIRYKSLNASNHGAPAYVAPELFTSNQLSRASDIYSLGIVMWEMWTRQMPWQGYGYLVIREQVGQGQRPPIPEQMPKQLQYIIRWCWDQQQHKRPTARQVKRYCKLVLRQLATLEESKISFLENDGNAT